MTDRTRLPLPEPDMQVVIGGQAFKIHSVAAIHAYADDANAALQEQVRALRDALNSTKPWLTPITPKRVAEAIYAALEATR